MSKVRILSIDGGGIRGILPGTLLTYLEERLRVLSKRDDAHIGEFFDFIVGTSTGGILSLVYLCPGADGGFKYTARQALDIYLEQGMKFLISRSVRKFKAWADLLMKSMMRRNWKRHSGIIWVILP